jgi:hypothetical protein
MVIGASYKRLDRAAVIHPLRTARSRDIPCPCFALEATDATYSDEHLIPRGGGHDGAPAMVR